MNKKLFKFNLSEIFKGWESKDFLILFGLIIMFTPTFFKLSTIGWKNASYDHGFFILPITLWLIFKNKSSLIKSTVLNQSGLFLFMGGVVIYLFSALNGFMFLEALSFVIIFWAIFKLRFTPESFKKMFFPLVYLLFLVPPPGVAIDAVSLPLKKISTMGAFLLLKSFHFPVDIYGVILSVGGKELLIGDACSGFRSISTLLALGAIYAYYQNISFQKKWIVFISVIPIAIVGNIARIAVTGVIVYYLGLKYAEGFFHSISGLILFVFTTLGLVVFTLLISRRNNEER